MTAFDLDDYILNTKKALYSAESSGQIKKLLQNFEDTITCHIDEHTDEGYKLCNKIFSELAIELLSDISFTQKKGAQNILNLSSVQFIDNKSKQILLDVFMNKWYLYNTTALCDAVCRYIHYDICNFNSELTQSIYKTLSAKATTHIARSSLSTALHFNCGIDIEE